MTTTKVALTISAEALEQAKKEVAAGRAKSLSRFVSEAVEEKIRRDEFSRLLDAMDARHGPPNKAARAWAKKVLSR
jgi:hypothetical protein